MRHCHLVALTGAIAIAITGCASEPPPSPPVTSSPASPAVSLSPNAAQPFAKPLVAQKPSGPGSTIPGLIQSTNPDERARQVQASVQTKRANDPFSAVPPVLPRPATTRTNVPRVPQLPAVPRPAPTSLTPSPNPTITPLPPIPSTDLASGVEVTGVIQVGNGYQAIIKAPNEPTSRYISVGQRIANGQVLVKRIEMHAGGDPVVILEENGVEVGKTVGEKPAVAKPAGQSA